jgi:hypothetical protein
MWKPASVQVLQNTRTETFLGISIFVPLVHSSTQFSSAAKFFLTFPLPLVSNPRKRSDGGLPTGHRYMPTGGAV